MRIGSIALGLVGIFTAACSAGTGGDADPSATHAQAAGLTSSSTSAPQYLALGDSIAFGDDGYVPWNDPSRVDASQFEGYPMEVAEILYGGAANVADLGCPGETTGSFLDTSAPDNGCLAYKSRVPSELHVPYTGSQMNAAIAYVTTNPVKLVTITLGGNDLLLLEYSCLTATGLDTTCVANKLPGVITNAATNVARIGGTLRAVGYGGPIVFVTQYATNYADPTQATVIPLFNGAIATAVATFGGKVASGYDAFQIASLPSGGDPCKAGLLIPNPNGDGTCDKHPSDKGRDLLGGIAAIASR